MQGLMQNHNLSVSEFLTYAATYHGDQEIVTRTLEGPIHRYGYRDAYLRAKKLSQALVRLGAEQGDVIGTLAWNTYRHIELYYGISGMGFVLHAVNPRLYDEQIAYIIDHAEDRFLFLDVTFVPLVERFAHQLSRVEAFIVLTDEAGMPETTLPCAISYESLLQAEDGDLEWPEVDENSACSMCYTSGTTGNPKGVVYSHRALYLHSLAMANAAAFGIGVGDVVMPIVPMYHANAWTLPYIVPMCGAKLVLPGANMEPESIFQLLDEERVTLSGAVPTVWTGLLQYLEAKQLTLPSLQRTIIGGSAVPKKMMDTFREKYGVQVIQAWGMTEMSPIGTMATPSAQVLGLEAQEQRHILEKQGRVMFTVKLKLTDENGCAVPRDGKSIGAIWVSGPCIASGYYKGEGGSVLDSEGWFPTGDVGTMDEYGYIKLVDRTKDVIKSGGEWISSIDVENAAVGVADVVQAAVIGVYHPKWEERPLILIVKKQGSALGESDVLDFLARRMAKWWLPEAVVFVDDIPLTATGKIDKKRLRDEYHNYLIEQA